MIKKLKNRFIRIAMLAVTGVLLLLVISVNTANLISVDRELKSTLKTISDNQGSVPRPAKGDMPKNHKAVGGKLRHFVALRNSGLYSACIYYCSSVFKACNRPAYKGI